MSQALLQFDGVSKRYARNEQPDRVAVESVSFSVTRCAVVAIVGRSGSGKSTLLHLAAGIETPTLGRVLLDGHDLAGLGDRERTLLRRRTVGLVFQFFHLLPHLSVQDNIALPEWIAGGSTSAARSRILELLERVGLADRARDPIYKLSGGEMQRVALCRALLRKPALLLADEPTGNLDDDNSRVVMDLLLQLVREESSTLLYVTHSRELAGNADAIWRLHSGELDRS